MEKENIDPSFAGLEAGNQPALLDEFSHEYSQLSGDMSLTSPVKPKKIDEDGFVTPTTPDIPKTSRHSVVVGLESSHHKSNMSVHTPGQWESLENSEQLFTHNKTVIPAERASQGEDCDQKVNQRRNGADTEALLCRFGQEAKQYHILMAEHFRNSVSFEEFLPQRVDKILQDALDLEQQLLEQKKRLKTRLQVLGQTLQKD